MKESTQTCYYDAYEPQQPTWHHNIEGAVVVQTLNGTNNSIKFIGLCSANV